MMTQENDVILTRDNVVFEAVTVGIDLTSYKIGQYFDTGTDKDTSVE